MSVEIWTISDKPSEDASQDLSAMKTTLEDVSWDLVILIVLPGLAESHGGFFFNIQGPNFNTKN